MLFFSLQLQRKLEIENDSKRKLELLVKERDRQLEMETMTRRDVESNKNHITDRVSSLEKLVSYFCTVTLSCPYAYAASSKGKPNFCGVQYNMCKTVTQK